MRTGAVGLLGLFACACATHEDPPTEAALGAPVPRSAEESLPIEASPAELSGGGVAALHRQALAATDPARSAQLLERACERGFAASCVALADRLESGEGVDADPERARGLLEQTCLDGSTIACDRLGH